MLSIGSTTLLSIEENSLWRCSHCIEWDCSMCFECVHSNSSFIVYNSVFLRHSSQSMVPYKDEHRFLILIHLEQILFHKITIQILNLHGLIQVNPFHLFFKHNRYSLRFFVWRFVCRWQWLLMGNDAERSKCLLSTTNSKTNQWSNNKHSLLVNISTEHSSQSGSTSHHQHIIRVHVLRNNLHTITLK